MYFSLEALMRYASEIGYLSLFREKTVMIRLNQFGVAEIGARGLKNNSKPTTGKLYMK